MDTVFKSARLEDSPAVVKLGRHYHKEFGAGEYFPFSGVVFERTVKGMISSDHQTIFLAEQNGEVIGAIGVTLFQHYYSLTICAAKLFWLAPKNSKVAVRLLRLSRAWAKSNGATKFLLPMPMAFKTLGSAVKIEQVFAEDL